MDVLGFLGLKRAGKDTAAAFLVNSCGYRRIAFADKLYQEVADAFGVTVAFLQADATKELPLPELSLRHCRETGFVACLAEELNDSRITDAFLDEARSPRQVLQMWGTEYRRKRGVDSYWLDIVAAQMTDPRGRYVITDVRFPNEIAFVRERAGRLVRVRRPARETAAGPQSATDLHPSEVMVRDAPVDREVFNLEGQPQALFDQLRDFLNS